MNARNPDLNVLLVLQRGHFRDSLVSLLHTLPQLEVACLVWREFNERSRNPEPDIIIIEAEPKNGIVDSLRRQWPDARILALINNAWFYQSAEFSGYDRVLPKSASVGEFLSFVNEYRRLFKPVLKEPLQPSIKEGIR